MMIIDAVECKDIEVFINMIDSYFDSESHDKVFTDSEKLYDIVSSSYGKDKCTYSDSIVALWLRISDNSLLILTDIENTTSEVFADLKESYTVVSVDDVVR